jgi:hypothetical protein
MADEYFPGMDVTVVATDFPSVDGSVPTPLPPAPPDRNVGHGRIFPRPDGEVAACGGPVLCLTCQADEGKRATAEALFAAEHDYEPSPAANTDPLPSDRPEFNRAVVAGFKQRGDTFPSTDGRLWSRAVMQEDGQVLCAWDRDGGFHLWGSVEALASALLKVAERQAAR